MFIFLLLFIVVQTALSATYVTGEVLYWIAQENGLTILYDSKGSSCFVDCAKAKNPHFSYQPGCRLTLGQPLSHSLWEINLQYTHIHNYINTRLTAPSCHIYFPVWLNSAATCRGFVTEVKSQWRLHYGNLDLNLERPFLVTNKLTLTPLFGLRGTVARQKYLIIYSGGSLFPCGATDKVHMKNKFWGIGPLAGGRAEVEMTPIFSLYGNVSFALLYGHFYVHQSEFVWSDRRLRVFDRFYLTRAIADFGLGLKARYRRITGHIGWEEHLLFGQNQLIRFVSSEVPGATLSLNDDLTLSGLIAGIRVDF